MDMISHLFTSSPKGALLYLTLFCFIGVSLQATKQRVCLYQDPNQCKVNKTKCNQTTEVCDPLHSHCYYAVQTFPNGTLNILQGCWKSDDCIAQADCLANPKPDGPNKDVLFCCCDGDLCNKNLTLDPTYKKADKEPEKDAENEIETTVEADDHRIYMYSLLPMALLAIAIIIIYFMYRQHQHAHLPLPQHEAAQGTVPGMMAGDHLSSMMDIHNNMVDSFDESKVNLLEVKARGRFGCVWKATMENRDVAVKVFPIQDRSSFLTERDFYNLPQIGISENILKFITAEVRGNNLNKEYWLITEYHENGSLYDYLKGHLISWPELLKLAESMACGLAFLHEDRVATNCAGHKPAVAHRDFKSRNVLVKKDLSCCIADLGLALKFEPGKCVGEVHGQVGTRRYMAPEVLEGAISFSRDSFHRIDMYACGLVLWELATRCKAIDGPVEEYRLPFEEEVGQHPTLDEMQVTVVTQKLRPRIKEVWLKHPGMLGLKDTIEECWDPDPEARLSAGCVEERLRQIKSTDVSSLPTPNSPPTPPPPPPPVMNSSQPPLPSHPPQMINAPPTVHIPPRPALSNMIPGGGGDRLHYLPHHIAPPSLHQSAPSPPPPTVTLSAIPNTTVTAPSISSSSSSSSSLPPHLHKNQHPHLHQIT